MKKSLSRIDYSKGFNKQLKKAPLSIKIALRQRLGLFIADQFHPQLNNHTLTGKYKGYRSINVTGDIRAIFKRDSESALFVAIDYHSNLYR